MKKGQKMSVSDCDSGISGLDQCETEYDFLNYTPVPTLESMALVNVVVQLWKHEDFREEITERLSEFFLYCDGSYKRMSESFLDVSKRISEMPLLVSLPNLLKERAGSVIRPIGGEMSWLRQFERCRWHCNSKTERIDLVCFTMKGTIDKAKSLERMLGKVGLGDIFDKACEYCLEDLVADLWKQMPDETRESYVCDVFQGYDRHLIAYWTCFMRNEMSKLMRMIEPRDMYIRNRGIYWNMFKLSVSKGKSLAAKYFWNKLTDGERFNSLVEFTCSLLEEMKYFQDYDNEYSDVMFFLLSQIHDKEHRKEMFHKYGAVVLRSLFLDWPWQTFLLPRIQSMWEYLQSSVYIKFLERHLLEDDFYKSNEKLFRGLWCNTPISFRKHFIQHISIRPDGHIFEKEVYYESKYCALSGLFDVEDMELIELVLNDADVVEKNLICSSVVESYMLYDLIETEKFSLVDMVLGEYLTSECEIKEFKANKVMEYGDKLCCYWIEYDNWGAVEKLLDWGFDSQDQVNALKAKIVNRMKAGDLFYELCSLEWSKFECFMNWCFNSEEEMDLFKVYVSSYDRMENFIRHIISFNPDFEFLVKFVAWAYSSEEEIVQFKKKVLCSEWRIDIYWYFLKIYGHTRHSFIEFLKVITQWFEGFEKDEIIECKKRIEDLSVRFTSHYHGMYLKCLDTLIQGDTDLLTLEMNWWNGDLWN